MFTFGIFTNKGLDATNHSGPSKIRDCLLRNMGKEITNIEKENDDTYYGEGAQAIMKHLIRSMKIRIKHE